MGGFALLDGAVPVLASARHVPLSLKESSVSSCVLKEMTEHRPFIFEIRLCPDVHQELEVERVSSATLHIVTAWQQSSINRAPELPGPLGWGGVRRPSCPESFVLMRVMIQMGCSPLGACTAVTAIARGRGKSTRHGEEGRCVNETFLCHFLNTGFQT